MGDLAWAGPRCVFARLWRELGQRTPSAVPREFGKCTAALRPEEGTRNGPGEQLASLSPPPSPGGASIFFKESKSLSLNPCRPLGPAPPSVYSLLLVSPPIISSPSKHSPPDLSPSDQKIKQTQLRSTSLPCSTFSTDSLHHYHKTKTPLTQQQKPKPLN